MGSTEKVIIFPIFDECKNYTLDKYWIECFTNFASNKFPPGIKYDPKKKTISIKKNNNLETIALPDDPPLVFGIMMDIMKKKLGMKSTRDIKLKDAAVVVKKDQKKPDLRCEFKKIKLKHLKDQLIMDYIGTLRERYKLTNNEYNIAVACVNLGFQFKSITPDNVVYENGKIATIKGLTFDEKERRFVMPNYTKISNKSDKTVTTDYFVTGMKKFIKENNLRVQKFMV